MANNNQIYKMSNAGGFKSLTRYYDMLAGNTTWAPWEPQGAYDALATVTLSAATSSVTFNGIPSTYKHLQIRWFSSCPADTNIRFNSDAGNNYAYHYLYGAGTSAAAGNTYGVTAGYLGYGAFSSPTAFAAGVTDILDYASTSKYKTVRTLMGNDGNTGGGGVMLTSTLWQSTSAISSITLIGQGGNNFAQYSSFALYGVK